METKGYNGKILKVNLTEGTTEVEEKDDVFYRMHLGGSALGTWYCLNEMPAGTDALAPEAVLVLAPSVLTGAAVPGMSRFTVTARSPLGGTIGDSQCGGSWGPELKFAGFDAVVVTGKSAKPVYLFINNGKAEIRDASAIQGLDTAQTRDKICEELDDSKVATACIGPGGEKLVRFACISGGASNYAGRTGMGAVMGSKNLKAISCRGKKQYEYADPDGVKKLSRLCGPRFKNSGLHQLLRDQGTAGVVAPQHGGGNMSARNFTHGSFEAMEKINGEAFKEQLVCESETCYSCIVRCKKHTKADTPYSIDPALGGPEFETIVMLGSNLMIDDPAAIAKANEMCNAYGIDTISTGAMIALLTESIEAGVFKKDGSTPDLKFGNAGAVIETVRLIGEREGIGDILAEGPTRAIEKLGPGAEKFAIHVKGNPFPAHMPQVKMSQALTYAMNSYGADHMASEHDWFITAPVGPARALGLYETREASVLDYEKVKMTAYTQMFYSVIDSLTLCAFCWGPDALYNYSDLETAMRVITGWDMTLWELMKVGERRINMMRAFNAREGFTAKDDKLPERMFTPMPEGLKKGAHVPKADLEKALKDYYALMGWDKTTGNPGPDKLQELGIKTNN